MQHVMRGLFGWSVAVGCALMAAPSASASPVITEFLASNETRLADEDGAFSDWIEIHNPDAAAVSLAGYHLTDDPADPTRWSFPAMTLGPGAYLVVFASGKNRTDPAGRLHTDFALSAGGEYLALVGPDGRTVVSGLDPAFPPQFEDVSFGVDPAAPAPGWSFFATPTPGAPNGSGVRAGPTIQPVALDPPQPPAGPLVVSARLVPVNGPVGAASVYYRRMYAAEGVLPLRDDGVDGDAVAGDGVWSATIPAASVAAGDMTRWRFTAVDDRGSETREPAYRDPLDSPQYLGTVPADPDLQSLLPVLHWFTTSPAGAGTLTGSRGSVFYDGEFYDNVLYTLHGQSSSGFPKKSYNIDFNRVQRFRWSTNAPRVADIDLLTNWADKSKVRHVLGYEVMRLSGVPAHFAFTVRVEQNGRFFSTADFVEDADELYLERAGLNPDGALYKVYSNLLNKDGGDTATTGVEKKTRRFENNSDLQELINGLDLTGPALERYLYDHIDIPRCVNLLAANSVIRNIDMHSKNWYIYRDTGRSGEWAMLPWDLDLSFGRVWNTANTYFDNALYTDGFVVTGTSIRLAAHLFSNPGTRAMLFRRLRTLHDRYLQPPPAPGTPEDQLYLERRLNEQSALIDPASILPSDARLDFEKWGSWLQGGASVPYTHTGSAVETMAEAIQRWKTEYLPARRAYIYNTQIVGRGGEIPLPQTGGGPTTNYTALVTAGATARVLVPTGGSLGVSWTGTPAAEPFNTAGWTAGPTGVGYERATGYEALIGTDVDVPMRSNTSVYIRLEFAVADPAAYDHLELRMKYDDGFVAYLNGTVIASAYAPAQPQWNSSATVSHEANPAAFVLYNVTAFRQHLRAGRNILAIHGLNDQLASSDMIIVPELHGGVVVAPPALEPLIGFGAFEVSPASGNQDQEFLQLVNRNGIAVDISDWRLEGALQHTFTGGTVLPPGGTLHVTPDAAAFRARTVSPRGGEGRFVQAGYRGRLTHLGGTVVLRDASGATNSTFTWPGELWDVQRHLVVSELLYHPAGDGLAEFIELLNISPSVTLDLRGVRFTQGIEFDFTGTAFTNLPPGGRVLVVRDLAAFQDLHGTHLPVAGIFANGTALANGGERLRLEDADGGTIQDFTYDDRSPWPTAADRGYSLVLVAPETHPDPTVPAHWRASRILGGTPGRPEGLPVPADPAGDADQNGERDLIDYVLGTAPGAPSSLPIPTFQPGPPGGNGTLRLSCPASLLADGATLGLSFSLDLEAWEDATPHLELESREPLGEGRELLTWRVKPPLRDAPQVFLRLRATLR